MVSLGALLAGRQLLLGASGRRLEDSGDLRNVVDLCVRTLRCELAAPGSLHWYVKPDALLIPGIERLGAQDQSARFLPKANAACDALEAILNTSADHFLG